MIIAQKFSGSKHAGAIGALVFFFALVLSWSLQRSYLTLKVQYFDEYSGRQLDQKGDRFEFYGEGRVMRVLAVVRLPAAALACRWMTVCLNCH